MCLNDQVCKDEKESREESSAREKSSAARAEEVTPEVTKAKQSSYRRAQKTTPIVRRRVPRQLTPTETESKQVNLGGKCHFSKYTEMKYFKVTTVSFGGSGT